MIEVKNVTKVYGKKLNTFMALEDVSFNLEEGSTTAIIGKSGSGKSTLMHIMSGLDHPTAGQIIIGGIEIHNLKPKAVDAFRASKMSFIFQSFFVEPNQTVYQNVMLPLEISNTARRKRKKMVIEALKAVDLSDKVNNNASELSGGQKQRLAIARSIVNKPKLIFADEPTGNLDSATGDMIVDLLFYLNKTLGCSVVIVTHDEELAGMCETQIRLKDGRLASITEKNKRTKKGQKPAKKGAKS